MKTKSIPQLRNIPLRDHPESNDTAVIEKKVSRNSSEPFVLDKVSGYMKGVIDIEEEAQATIEFPEESTRRTSLDTHLTITVQRNASVKLKIHAWDTQDFFARVKIILAGKGAHAQVRASFHGRDEDHHGMNITMQHVVPQTTGDIAIRGVFEESSRAVFAGLIRIDKHAQQTTSYFRDDVLLLDSALADSLPTLEIEANDVKASHGSTTSRISDDQLFYLQSRGLRASEAKRMIIEGFLKGFSES